MQVYDGSKINIHMVNLVTSDNLYNNTIVRTPIQNCMNLPVISIETGRITLITPLHQRVDMNIVNQPNYDDSKM